MRGSRSEVPLCTRNVNMCVYVGKTIWLHIGRNKSVSCHLTIYSKTISFHTRKRHTAQHCGLLLQLLKPSTWAFNRRPNCDTFSIAATKQWYNSHWLNEPFETLKQLLMHPHTSCCLAPVLSINPLIFLSPCEDSLRPPASSGCKPKASVWDAPHGNGPGYTQSNTI